MEGECLSAILSHEKHVKQIYLSEHLQKPLQYWFTFLLN